MLENNPEGLSEYELLSGIDNSVLASSFPSRSDTFGLFRAHFLLFHVLYRLRRQWLHERKMLLEISALKVVLRKLDGDEKLPEQYDSLADYYLDFDNYYQASPESVEAMLSRFHVLFASKRYRAEALAVLGLVDPVDDTAIRQAYRERVMQHHPDRGGNADKAAEINRAFDRLLRQRSGSF